MENVNRIFTGDVFFDWAESHLCNQSEPGLFTCCFNSFSDVTGYLPHLLVDSVVHWTGDFEGAMEMIHHPDGKGFFENRISEIGGVASLLLNGTAKGAALSLRVALTVVLALSAPAAIGGIVFFLSPVLPGALIAGATAAVCLLVCGGVAKYIEGNEPVVDENAPVIIEENLTAWKDRYVGERNPELFEWKEDKWIGLAHDFIADIPRTDNKINDEPYKNTKEAVAKIMEILRENETGTRKISEVFNQASGIALETKMMNIYKSRHSHTPYIEKDKDKAVLPAISYHLHMVPGKPVTLDTAMKGTFNKVIDDRLNFTDLETAWEFEAKSTVDFAAETVTTTISVHPMAQQT